MRRMELWPAAGASGRRLLEALRSLHAGAVEALNAAEVNRRAAYLGWAGSAEMWAAGAVRRSDLDEFVLTPMYWAIVANPSAGDPTTNRAIALEVERCVRWLDQAITDTDRMVRRWSIGEWAQFVIPDTNLLIHHREPVQDLDWRAALGHVGEVVEIQVVLPMTVIDEMDSAKFSNKPYARTRARTTIRTLYERLPKLTDKWELEARSSTVAPVSVQVLADPPGHARLSKADGEIVDRARALHDLSGAVVHFVTFDAGAAYRADVAGLQVHHLGKSDMHSDEKRQRT